MGWLKRTFRDGVLHVLRRALATGEGRDMIAESVRGLQRPDKDLDFAAVAALRVRYPDLGAFAAAEEPTSRQPVFVTSRFRSGSTLLWNVFRHTSGCTSYYEPLNERRWFNARRRGERIDRTHHGVTDYWREYAGLDDLDSLYDETWIDHNLYMDADFPAPALQAFLDRLIDAAPARPVLQMNRIDFRLPWIRRRYRHARIVHLYRHPRAQWVSTLMGEISEEPCPREVTAREFERYDELYLLRWCRDLKHQFPFLDEDRAAHPYRLSYYLWKLSYLFGATYADHSLSFEQILDDPEHELSGLMAKLEIEPIDGDRLASLIRAPQPARWRDYAPDDWFEAHEIECERVLADFFGTAARELTPMV